MESTATSSLPVSLRKYPATKSAECLMTGYGYPGEVGKGTTEAVLVACLFLPGADEVAAAPTGVGVHKAEYMSTPFVIAERSFSTTASLGMYTYDPLVNTSVL